MLTISWKSSTKGSKSPRNLAMIMKISRRRRLCRKTKDSESRSSTQTRMAITNRRITAKQSFRKMTDNIVKINNKTDNRMTGEIRNSKSSSQIKFRRKISTLKTSGQNENILRVGTLTSPTSGPLARPGKNIKRNPKVSSTTRHKMTSRLSSRPTSSTMTQTQTLSFHNSSSTIASNISPTSPNLPSTIKTTILVTKTHNRAHTILQTISNRIFHLIHSAKVLRKISLRLFHKIPKSHFS